MTLKIFLPDNLKRDFGILRGKQFQNIICVVDNYVDSVAEDEIKVELHQNDKQLNLGIGIVIKNNIPIMVVQDRIKISAWIVYYSPPIPGSLQFYSVKPLLLDLHSQQVVKSPTMASKLPIFSSTTSLNSPDIVDLEECLNFINTAPRLATKSIKFRSWLSSLFLKIFYPIFYSAFFVASFILRFVLQIIEITRIAKASRVASQLQLRIQQLLFWPPQYFKRQESEIKLSPIAQAQYIGFFNTVWLIANDIIIGFALKTVILDHSNVLISQMRRVFQNFAINWVIDMQKWLLSWPGGLKLNSELGTFLSNLFEWMILAWNATEQDIIQYWPILIYMTAILGIFGATFVISAFEDLIRLFTLHLRLIYMISARIFNWSLFTLKSTFNLFQGKKWNPLRQRVDSAQYELDQFLMGTIIFTLFMFLLPTISVFYLFYGIVNLILLLTQGILEFLLIFLNHFPLFALMLRIKDPQRLSGKSAN